MADFSSIIQEVNADINTNGANEITGAKLNKVLRDMITAVNAAKQDPLTIDATPTEDSTNPVQSGGLYAILSTMFAYGCLYGGIVGPQDSPTFGDDHRYFYIAKTDGRYVNFNNYEVDGNVVVFSWNENTQKWRYVSLCPNEQAFDDLLENKADKVWGATSGNLAGLDSYGNPTDSGIAANEVATKAEVAALIGAIQQFHYEIYATLPQTGQGNVLYLIGPIGSGSDRYEEYVYANNAFTKIGDTSIDLSGYVTSSALNTALADYTTTASLTELLSGKQDTISDLSAIRSGASAGTTAYQKPQSGIPQTDLASSVQTLLWNADTAYQKPQSGIPESDLSSDVQQALNKHFKGWFSSLEELKAAHTAVEGDSAYVKDASPATTWSIYTYDSTAITDNKWADSGRTADTSRVQTFASGEEVNEVHIVNDLNTGGVDDVLSAEQGKQLKQYVTPIVEATNENVSFTKTYGDLNSNGTLDEAKSPFLSAARKGLFLPFAENTTIYKIRFKIANHIYTAPFTKVAFSLHKDLSENFDVLYSAVKNISFNDTLPHEIEFELENPVSYSGVIYASIQVESNGGIDWWHVPSEDYIFPPSSYYRYVTSDSYTEGVEPTWSAAPSSKPLYIQYWSSVEEEYSIEFGSDEISDGAITTSKLDDKAVTLDKLGDDVFDEFSQDSGVKVHLPSDIYAVVGSRLQLFYRGIVEAVNPYNYNIEVTVLNSVTGATVGDAFPRYYRLDAKTTNIGDYNLTINVRNNNNTIIASGTSIIHVIDAPSSPQTMKNILAIGASVMTHGFINGEIRRRLTTNTGSENNYSNPLGLNLSNIGFIGRKTGTTITDINQEATGGWGWYNYIYAGTPRYRFYITDGSGDTINIDETFILNGLTFTVKEKNISEGIGNISCTYTGNLTDTIPQTGVLPLQSGNVNYSSYIEESSNPFYNPNTNQIDFANYATNYCDGATIDIIYTQLGVNNMAGATWDKVSMENHIKTFLRAYKAYCQTSGVNGMFVISTIAVPDNNGGFGYNYHANGAISNFYTILKRFFEFTEIVENISHDDEFASFVVHAPVMPLCDGENMYPYHEANVNNRSSVKEKIGINAYHPQIATTQGGSVVYTAGVGDYLIADAIYNTLCSIL